MHSSNLFFFSGKNYSRKWIPLKSPILLRSRMRIMKKRLRCSKLLLLPKHPTTLERTNILSYEPYCLVLLHVTKCFVPIQFFLRQSKNLTAFIAYSKTFVPAQKGILLNANHLFAWHKMFVTATIFKQIFGPAQKIWTSTKHFGTCKRTRHHIFTSLKL